MKAPQQRAHWHDAYDAQMAMWRWYRTDAALRWVRSCIAAQTTHANAEELRDLLTRCWDGEMGRLLDCDPIYVSDEMCELVDVAREGFKPEPLLETDLITPRGFLWFAKPLYLPDRFEYPLAVRAVSWSREYASATEEQAEQVYERLYSAGAWARGDRIRADEMEGLIEDGLMYPAGITIVLYADRDHYLNVTNGGDVPDWVRPATAPVPVVPFHTSPWHFHQTTEGDETDFDGQPTGVNVWWSMLQSTFRLMQQRLAHRAVERPPRAQRREAKKLGAPYEPEVVVVRLRREETPRESNEPGFSGRTLTHRHIRSGHWRNQWYESEQLHRQIWIYPTVVGDPSLPLIVRPRRVWQWER